MKLMLIVFGIALVSPAMAQDSSSLFDPGIAMKDDCAVEGMFAENVAKNRDSGASLGQELKRFASYPVADTPFDKARAAADEADIRFAFAKASSIPDSVRAQVFQRCMAKHDDPSYYAGKEQSSFNSR